MRFRQTLGDAGRLRAAGGASLTLQWNRKGRQDRELAASVALAEQAKAEREEAARTHMAEVRLMLNEWQDNRAPGPLGA